MSGSRHHVKETVSCGPLEARTFPGKLAAVEMPSMTCRFKIR